MSKRITSISKQEMIEAMAECAKKLGRPPSQTEARKMKGITVPMIRRNFGTYTQLLGECEMEIRPRGQKLDTEMLLRDWARVVRQLKKLPSVAVYEHLSNYTETPFRVRFGGWMRVPQGFKRYAMEKGWNDEWKDVLEMIDRREREDRETAWMFGGRKERGAEQATEKLERKAAAPMTDRPVYGPAMRPYPMAYGPMNEIGVIFLFGTQAERLGFIVTRLQAAFPDCEAMRWVEGNRWQPVRIEFEYESRNFLKHKHDAKKCDLIVCWEHNWPECPVEVLELKTLLS
jgi:hypothetical protein